MWMLGFIIFVLTGIVSIGVTGWLFVKIITECYDMWFEHMEQEERKKG